MPAFRLTSDQVSPLSSLPRIPVNSAVTMSGRQRPESAFRIARSSSRVVPEIGSIRLNALTPPRINQFIDTLLGTRSRVLTRKVLTSLGSLIDEAVRRGLAAYNPAA